MPRLEKKKERFTRKKVLKATLIVAFIILFMSTWANLHIGGASTTRFTRRQIEALQYEFEFILPEGAQIVRFVWRAPTRPPTISVAIAGIRDLDDFLENNLLFELSTPDGRPLTAPIARMERSFHLLQPVYAVRYVGIRGPHLEKRQIDRVYRHLITFSVDDGETSMVEITQRSFISSSPYRATLNAIIVVHLPIELFKIIFRGWVL